MKRIITFTLAAFVGGFLALAGAKYFFHTPTENTSVLKTETPQPAFNFVSNSPIITASVDDFTLAASKTVDGVVHVKTEVEVQNVNNPWADFFGSSENMEPYIQHGSGSGVIISKDGYIITNNHVIDGADKIKVSLNDNKSYDAELVGTDPTTDIAVLKIKGENLPAIEIGDSEKVKIGQWVLAVGNPFDLTSTVTAGIVSAKARNINLLNADYRKQIYPIESFIQTDAAVNPGNSGGALVNTSGELIGINTAIASRTGSFTGYSFAVPSSIASKVAEDLIQYGQVQRAYIGVRIQPVTEEMAEEFNLPSVNGIHVSDLTENGAAFEAGIKSGDIILEVNSVEVNSVPQLQEQISKYRPGDEVGVTLWRNSKKNTLTVELRDTEGGTDLKKVEKTEALSLLGADFYDVDKSVASKLGIDGGAQVVNLERGKLSFSGIKEGFIVTKIDGLEVKSAKEFQKIISKKSGGILLEGVYENGVKAYYGFGI
ncbi:MAG: Do family serine endopeptidase [Flavobacteriales bacterium]